MYRLRPIDCTTSASFHSYPCAITFLYLHALVAMLLPINSCFALSRPCWAPFFFAFICYHLLHFWVSKVKNLFTCNTVLVWRSFNLFARESPKFELDILLQVWTSTLCFGGVPLYFGFNTCHMLQLFNFENFKLWVTSVVLRRNIFLQKVSTFKLWVTSVVWCWGMFQILTFMYVACWGCYWRSNHSGALFSCLNFFLISCSWKSFFCFWRRLSKAGSYNSHKIVEIWRRRTSNLFC